MSAKLLQMPSLPKIHPYDAYDLICSAVSVKTVGEVDEIRLAGTPYEFTGKASVLEIDGVRYIETTLVPYKSKTFDAYISEGK